MMYNKNKQQNKTGKRLGNGWWVMLGSVALLALALLGGAEAWAAPTNKRLNQTIPRPTPTAEATEVPTVTPTTPAQSPTDTPPPANPPASPTATSVSGGGGSAPTNPPPPTNTPAAASTPAPAAGTATTVPAFALRLQLEASPAFARQGSEVTLRFTVTNPGNVAATNVQVRNELPSALSLVENSATGGTVTTERNAAGATVILISWPSLGAGAKTEATLRVRVAPNTLNGTVIDNLAVAWADNAAASTAAISIGMPPALLPTFD